MTRRTKGLLAILAGAAAVAMLPSCKGVLFLAPPGSDLSASANPEFIASNGGTSLITVFITEPARTPVSDGTVVLFTTNLGQIPRQAKTKDGFAQAIFVSDARSGEATITIISGGSAPAPVPTSTPSPGGGGGGPVTASRAGTVTAFSATDSAAASCTTGTGSATCTIRIGNVRVKLLRLRAEPPRITTSNSTHVFATVFDEFGNPIPEVPVYFRVVPPPDPTSVGLDFFDIQGPVYTNNNGEAENVLRTRRQVQGTATVTAAAPGAGAFVEATPLPIPIL